MGTRSKKILLFFFAIIIAGFFVFQFAQAHAVDFGIFKGINPPIDSITGEPGAVLNKVFNIIITIAEVTFIIMFFVGGLMYLTSMGDEAKNEKAKKLILDAVIGMVIVLAAWAIGTWILTTLKGNNSAGSNGSSNSSTNPTDVIKDVIKNNNGSSGTSGSDKNPTNTSNTPADISNLNECQKKCYDNYALYKGSCAVNYPNPGDSKFLQDCFNTADKKYQECFNECPK